MHLEAQIVVTAPRAEVFDYLAHAEYLPEYASDFVWVRRIQGAKPGLDAEYAYKMKRGTEGTFRHSVYEPHSRLVWQGPPARSGPGTMAPSGMWELSDIERGTRVNLVMSPTPGGLLRIMAPVISKSVARQLPSSLTHLKERLEGNVQDGSEGGPTSRTARGQTDA
jgi:uncharacterized protein YndB with AHSA1/START domain